MQQHRKPRRTHGPLTIAINVTSKEASRGATFDAANRASPAELSAEGDIARSGRWPRDRVRGRESPFHGVLLVPPD
jgi:hypothetical protein